MKVVVCLRARGGSIPKMICVNCIKQIRGRVIITAFNTNDNNRRSNCHTPIKELQKVGGYNQCEGVVDIISSRPHLTKEDVQIEL